MATLTRADLRRACLEEAILTFADLTSACLHKANLRRAALNESILHHADFREAMLAGANLRRTELVGAQLIHGDLTAADLTEANLTAANFQGALLHGTNFSQAIFDEADRERFDALVQHREKYRQIRQQVFALREEGRQPEARALLKGWLWPAYLEYTRAAEKLFDNNITLGKARGQSILRVCTITQLVVTVVGIAVFVGGFLAPFIVVRYGGASRVRP